MGLIQKWRAYFDVELFSSGTVTVTGNTGIIATPGVETGGNARFPIAFVAVGTGLATDEVADIVIDWYFDSAGTGGAIATTTFNQLTAGAPTDVEPWPGDVLLLRDNIPIFPFHKVTYTLGGTTKSMSLIVNYAYLELDA